MAKQKGKAARQSSKTKQQDKAATSKVKQQLARQSSK
jgi:hypothetical protein